MSEPMITIKKADGTFAKVPLSEFKKMQSRSSVIPAKAGIQTTQSDTGSPNKSGMTSGVEPARPATHLQAAQHHNKPHTAPHHAVKHHPVHIKEQKKQHHLTPHHAKPASRADAGSLLEEKIPAKGHGVLFSPKREKQVEMVISKLGFSVAPDLLGRLKSLVLARLKDLKSEDEARELLSRSVKNGGLGLTEPQVEKVLQLCHEVGEMEHGHEISAPVLKGNSFLTALHSLESELELSAPSNVISPPPFTKRGQGEMPKTALGSATSATPLTPPLGKGGMTTATETRKDSDVISKLVAENAASEPVFKLNTQAAARKSMQDVSAAAAEMGPAEEIKSTSLTDFRRLSGNPEEAARRLQQKMFNLQDESFVLYLDALAAYRASPLYNEYMRAVCQSLAERKPLANVLAMQNGIKLNEVEAMVEMERSL